MTNVPATTPPLSPMLHSTEEANPSEPIKCIFLCEFHFTAGPKIVVQVPENYINKDEFALLHQYIIPKKELHKSFVSVSLIGKKILGYPVRIDNKQYARNFFHFNICFVFHPTTRTITYEPIIRKLSDHLLSMELATKLLSQQSSNPVELERLHKMLDQARNEINRDKKCMLQDGSIIPLSVIPLYNDDVSVHLHHAPVLLERFFDYKFEEWDLTTLRVYPYLNGYNHICRVAMLADVALELVQECVRHLVIFEVAIVVPVFQYCNVYRPTPRISQLAKCKELQKSAISKCSRSPLKQARYQDIFRMFASMTHGATLGELCVRFNPAALNINERETVLFGLIHGLIRCVQKFPVSVKKNLFTTYDKDEAKVNKPVPRENKRSREQKQAPGISLTSYNGTQPLDEICVTHGLSIKQLEEHLAKDKHVIVLQR